jgi:protein O-mannosyl-transferase
MDNPLSREAVETRPSVDEHVSRVSVSAVTLTVLVLLSGCLYLNTLDGAFVYDDLGGIVSNESIRNPARVGRLLRHNPTRPLVNVSYAIDYARSQLNPRAYHVTNIALHVLNVSLLYLVVCAAGDDWRKRREDLTFNAPVAAFTAAALFAAHPIMTEAVAYSSGRSELLVAAFFLGALIAGRRALLEPRPAWIALTWTLMMLALASKELAIVVPVMLSLYGAWVLRQTPAERRTRWLRMHGPMFGTVAVIVAARVWLLIGREYADSSQLSWRNAALELEMLARYARLFVWPVGLSLVHEVNPIVSLGSVRAVLAIASVAAVAMLVASVRKTGPLVAFGLAWFALVLLPSAVLVVLIRRSEFFAEHRVYLAGCGLFLCAGVAMEALWRRHSRWRVLVFGAGAAIVAVLATATLARNAVWQHPLLLWRSAVESAPGMWAAHYGYGRALHEDGDYERAIQHYRRAIAIRPGDEGPYQNLVICLAELRRPEEARAALDDAVRLAPAAVPTREAAVAYAAAFGSGDVVRAACADLRDVSPDAALAMAECRR